MDYMVAKHMILPPPDYVKSSTAMDTPKMGITKESTEKRMARAGATLVTSTVNLHGSLLV